MAAGSFLTGLSPDNRAGGSLVGPGNGNQSSSNLAEKMYPTSWGNTQQVQEMYPTSGRSPQASRPISYAGPTQPGSNFPILYGRQQQSPLSTQPINTFGGIQSMVDSIYGPQQQMLDDQRARQLSSLGLIGEDVGYRQTALERDNALARQGLGIDRRALGIDQGLIGTQKQNLERLRAILKQQYGLAGKDLELRLKQFGVDEAQLKDMAGRKQWDLRSDLTQRGAFNTIANERGTGRINRDLEYGLAGVNTQRGQAMLGYQGNKLGLDEKGIGYDNQAAGLNARLANIGLDSERLGISEQQLANSLQDGLRQIGLEGYASVNSLLDAIGGTNQQQAQLAGTILSEILAFAPGLTPQQIAQLQQSLSGNGGKAPRVGSPRNRT